MVSMTKGDVSLLTFIFEREYKSWTSDNLTEKTLEMSLTGIGTMSLTRFGIR